jgi:hypothetical protein
VRFPLRTGSEEVDSLPAILSIPRRVVLQLLVLSVIAGVVLAIPTEAQGSHPFVSTSNAQYAGCGRVFPDPHAYWPAAPGPAESPFAKGNLSCRADDFLTYRGATNGMVPGMNFLEGLFPDFLEFYELETDFGDGDDCAASTSQEDLCSAGLPGPGGTRRREDLYMVRVTDERVPETNKKYFVFPLSIHGIERAGAEAGTRAAEDLATWAYCEAVANGEAVSAPAGGATINCNQEAPIPHPILETQPGSISAGQALKGATIYFVWANADGWRRGDPDNGVRFFQRYNGNGVDMNRDWPTSGFTFRPYTPWSEPETRSFGEVLQGIRPKWDGGIDLHGQLIDRAFSFTLLGAGQHTYAKNQRILQTVKGAWEDAEQRLEWSPLIKPNDAPADNPGGAPAPIYGVQWGTVWDTIDYTTTGSFGDWINSPLGLDADGIDNEMSLSHISNCGVGSCYADDAEQLHVDGNKSLVYAMVNYTLLPEDTTFRAPGKVGYVFDPRRLQSDGNPAPTNPGLPTQAAILNASLAPPNYIYEFTVEGPDSDPAVYNGGITGTATPLFNVNGVSGTSVSNLILERLKPLEENPPGEDTGCGAQDDEWEEVNRYFNQDSLYLQAGQAVHGNYPSPGTYRICYESDPTTESQIAGLTNPTFDLDITFQGEQAWEDPGQLPYDVSNMDFFKELEPFMRKNQLDKLPVNKILKGTTQLRRYDSLVIADNALPGYSEKPPTGPAQDDIVVPLPAAATTPCAGDASSGPPCSEDHEFDVDPSFNNQSLVVHLQPTPAAVDYDLYVQRLDPDSGNYVTVGQSATGSADETVTLNSPPDGHYRARIVNWSGGGPIEELQISFSDEYAGPTIYPSTRKKKQVKAWGKLLLQYAKQGGNLVLTDGAIKDLGYMGVIPDKFIRTFTQYAGYVGFTADGGGTDTYSDFLAKDVNQPGAAEGEGHRHQTYEPVPLGFPVQDDSGADYNGAFVTTVDQSEWEKRGGRTAGTTSPQQVSLGELPIGKGQVRIIGALLPMPSEESYHPFGLSSYALTYTGYQVFNNALQAGGARGCGRVLKLPDTFNKILGTEARDLLVGTAGPDAICGGGDNDRIKGLDGDDVIVGGKGNDRLVGGTGNDKLYAGAGNDRALGGKGNDRIVGFQGSDRLGGSGGRDKLNGQGGTDKCKGGSGNDKVRKCEQGGR